MFASVIKSACSVHQYMQQTIFSGQNIFGEITINICTEAIFVCFHLLISPLSLDNTGCGFMD